MPSRRRGVGVNEPSAGGRLWPPRQLSGNLGNFRGGSPAGDVIRVGSNRSTAVALSASRLFLGMDGLTAFKHREVLG